MKTDWRAVLRDALGVLLVGYLGGLIGSAVGDDSGEGTQTVSVVVLMTVGFCVSGCLAKQARFKHLALVAAGVWLIGTIVNTISAGVLILGLSDIGLIAAAMLVGGLISLGIVKPPPAASPPAPPPPG